MSSAPRSLALVGMSGVGKSFCAKRLAARGYRRHDCDGAIAARLSEIVVAQPGEEPVNALGRWMGMPWTEGYAAREARYLALEEEVTREALVAAARDASEPHVVDTTGSVIYLPGELLADLGRTARVVYLCAPDAHRDKLLARYLAHPKPIVWGASWPAGGTEADLPRAYGELLAFRDARYRALAHVELEGGALDREHPDLDGFLARAFA